MSLWPMSSRLVAPRFCDCFFSPIGLALSFWVSQKVAGAFLRLQALNPHTVLGCYYKTKGEKRKKKEKKSASREKGFI